MLLIRSHPLCLPLVDAFLASRSANLANTHIVPCRLFRVVPAATFLQHFASDRSHMLSVEGSWQEVPPSYPCITAPDGATHTLPQYTEMPPFQEACSTVGEAAAALRRAAGAEDNAGQGGGNLRWGVVLTQPVFLECFGGG